ncbi:hypothetical protein VNO78_08693 [Psophocarpus tetragonolobus]|uniref:RING-type domain-containing protein n=1 Tax=Psophocarpus tetragonolobus TaxID=3891 RepID=A0AAN9SVF3_PSOTE
MGDGVLSNNVVILLIAVGSAALVVSIYHVIAICLCNHGTQNPPPPMGASSSVVHLIPTHTYRKKKVDHLVQGQPQPNGGEENGRETCAICLGDFEEGQELRTMPECMHSFHVACIDRWLSWHSSCPICRSSATPSLEICRFRISRQEVVSRGGHSGCRSAVLPLNNVVRGETCGESLL